MTFPLTIADREWYRLLMFVRDAGVTRPNRTGVPTRAVFGVSAELWPDAEFPIVTLKEVNFHAALCEILWMLRGGTDVTWLHEQGVHVWDPWARPDGTFGPIYGAQWRRWQGRDGAPLDQFERLLEGLRNDPYGRRHIVTAWRPDELDSMALPPCHCFMQFHVTPGYSPAFESSGEAPHYDLHLQVYQRSADLFVGVPFNWVHYAVLLHTIRRVLGSKWGIGKLTFNYGDLHLYETHMGAVNEVAVRYKQGDALRNYEGPELRVMRVTELTDELLVPSNYYLFRYEPQPAIRVNVAI